MYSPHLNGKHKLHDILFLQSLFSDICYNIFNLYMFSYSIDYYLASFVWEFDYIDNNLLYMK